MSAEHLRSLVHPTVLAGDQVLPVLPPLTALLPTGLRRGGTVAVDAAAHQGTTALALGLAAGASSSGSWCAAVGIPDLGLIAAAEIGVRLERLALVPSAPAAHWTAVVGALLDAVDLVIVRPPRHLRLGDARRLTARARERTAVLIPLLAGPAGPWADGVDVRLSVTAARWDGPGAGDGRLICRRAEVTAHGRGAAARPRRVELWLPGPAGTIEALEPVADPASGPVTGGDATPAYAGADIDRLPDDERAPFRTAG